MFQIRWRPRGDVGAPPDAMRWWEQSVQRADPTEEISRLTQQLRSAMARADGCERPVFLRALGRDIETELQELSARIAFGVGETAFELATRRELLEEWVDYYCEAVLPWTQAPRAVELSDCAREAVSGLSAKMVLLLRVEGEPTIEAGRQRLISLCELAIQAATAKAGEEVEVLLPPCSADHAELRVQWTPAPMSAGEGHDKARFLALAIAYVIKFGGALRRTATGNRDGLVLRIPMSQRSEEGVSTTPIFDSDVVAQATAFCLER